MFHFYISLTLLLLSCTLKQSNTPLILINQDTDTSEVTLYYNNHPDNGLPSQSIGSVSNGSLKNGKLIPFSGQNYTYFDTLSYISGRAFMNHKVKKTVLETYKSLETKTPNNHFGIMECSHEHGGKLFPHRTHQNGLSVDFMTPLMKDNRSYYGLDTLGADHYWIDFNNNGKYLEDLSISINFNLMAAHILEIEKFANLNGLKIKKVIFKMELKDELFKSENGKILLEKGIYITKKLPPLINSLHDDHYHIDFEKN